MKGLGINASSRWIHAIREAQYLELTRPRARAELSEVENAPTRLESQSEGSISPNVVLTAKENWKKAALIVKRAGLDQDSSASDSGSESSSGSSHAAHSAEERAAGRRRREEERMARRRYAKMMDLQYFLEMVDLKHRYGSNLHTYHEVWKKSDTHENFFYWLDYGEGRFIDVESCPRERLEREQVRYLSREERRYYLVNVDKDGRLCWAKNGVRIDTTEKWKDSIHGIVPADDPTPAFQGVPEHPAGHPRDSTAAGGSDSDDEASASELEAARAAKYATPDFDQAHGMTEIHHVSASTIFNKLLRKSVKKNTWIFVADTGFRLYVGIKSSGAFQHSSFLQGSRISAAGLIKIKNGMLRSLSPLSGHYRPPASNFRAFVKSLKQGGVDMRHVSISTAYVVLVGLEAYTKTRQTGKDLVKRLRQKKKMRGRAERGTSEKAERERRFHGGQDGRREENKAGVQIPPRGPAGHGGGEGGCEESAKVT